MLSSVDSLHVEPGLCVKSESSIVEEIRSALFLATSIIKDEASKKDSCTINDQSCSAVVQFECGHLEYSHVSEEWSVLHTPIPRYEDNMGKSGASEHPCAMDIASVRPVSSRKHSIPQSETLEKTGTPNSHNNKSTKETKGRQHKRKCRTLSADEYGNEAQSMLGYTLPLSPPLKYLPALPPIELVRCLLKGKEFISIMQRAREYVESSMSDGKKLNHRKSEVGSEAAFRPRRSLKERSINLQPMVIALLAPAIRASQPSSKASPLSSLNVSNIIGSHHDLSLETIILRFVDECIRFAHSHICDLIDRWSSCWQVRTNLLSTKAGSMADDENRSSLPASFTQNHFVSKLIPERNNKHNGNTRRNWGNSCFASIASIHQFVRTCFEESSKEMLHPNSVIASSTEFLRNPRVSSKELDDVSHRHIVSKGSKGQMISRRNKKWNRQPADSLVTVIERNHGDISSARKKIPAYKRKGSLVEKQRYQHLKYSRHLSPTSVLENTSTATLQGYPTRIIDKVKQRDYSSPKMRRRRCKSSERSGVMKKEHDTHKFKPRFEKEKMSPNSLYSFFETKECKSNRAKFYAGHTSSNIKDRNIHTSPSRQHDDSYSMPTEGQTTQSDGVSRDLLMQLESQIGKGECNSDRKSDSTELLEKLVSSDERRDHRNEPDQAISDKLNEKVSNLKDEPKTEDVDYNLPWVNLSHIGHISDYHGYKRKYEHFAQLQFGPIDDIRCQIQRTLVENDDESDEEVINDNRDYERAISQYEAQAQKERSSKKKFETIMHYKQREEVFDNMLVVFPSPAAKNEIEPASDTFKKRWNMKMFESNESQCSKPSRSFRLFDDNDDVVSSRIEDKTQTERKRKSRSAKIAHQKKTSNRMLQELFHTLNFIENYNRNPKCMVEESLVDQEKVSVDPGVNEENSAEQEYKTNTKERDTCKSESSNELELVLTQTNATLSLDSLLESYDAIRSRFSLKRSLDRKDEIEAMKQKIQSILDKEPLFHDFVTNEEIISEEKTLARRIRGYSSKSDQEKIEKRDFEEKQKLRQHEYQYYSRSRKRKKSPQDIEKEEISSRPIYFSGCSTSRLTQTDVCRFRPNCNICRPIRNGQSCNLAIFSPSFRRIETNINPYFRGRSGDNSPRNNISSNTSSSLEGQKLGYLLQLSELYYTLDFIDEYNKGMISSTKKRK